MVSRLYQMDLPYLQTFLEKDLSFNLILLDNIGRINPGSKNQGIWLEYSQDEMISAILMKHYGNYYVYAPSATSFDIRQFAQIIQQDRKFETLSGRAETVSMLCPYLRFRESKQLKVAELIKERWEPGIVNRARVQKATLADVEAITALKKQIAEFQLHEDEERSFRESLRSGKGRCYLLRIGDTVISTAATIFENKGSAMIVDVCTHPDHRNKGYATLCMNVLCQELLQEGRRLCLFYDNEFAGSVYRRLGFYEIGKWAIVTAERRRIFSFRHV